MLSTKRSHMLVHRICAGTLILSWSLLAIGATLSPVVAQAQGEGVSLPLVCPIESAPNARFVGLGDIVRVEDQLSTFVSLRNDSSYTFSGVRVGVGVYDRAGTLSYWAVLDGEHQLLPETSTDLPVELALQALPAGDYQLRVVALQGDETAVLGALVHETERRTDSVLMRKTTIRNSDVAIAVEVDGRTFSGARLTAPSAQPFSVKLVTKNNDAVPLLESNLLAVVTEGVVPLGTAVRADKLDSVKLIPSGTRTTLLQSVQTSG